MARLRIRSMMAERVVGHIAATDRPAWLLALSGLLAAALAMQANVPRPALGIVATLGLHLPVLLGAWAAARRLLARRAEATACAVDALLAGLIYFAAIIAGGLALGFAGVLHRSTVLPTFGGLALLLLWLGRGHAALPRISGRRAAGRKSGARPASSYPQVMSVLLRFAAFALILLGAFQCLAAPEYVYDVLNYHLTFAAEWVQSGAVSVTPTWFGDPAPGYAPAAMDVYFATLLLPAGGDSLARCGQFPAYLLLICAIATLARSLRLPQLVRAALVLIAAGLPGIAAQASTALVDVALAAWLCAAVAYALRLCRSRSPSDAVGLVLAAGLAAGTKFLAIVYLAAFAPLFVCAVWRFMLPSKHQRPAPLTSLRDVKDGWAPAATIAAASVAVWIGGTWYARNWLLAGNPVYPMRVEVGEATVFDGPFGREQMLHHLMNARRSGHLLPFARVLWQALSFGARGDFPTPSLAIGSSWLGGMILGGLGALLGLGAWWACLGKGRPRGAALLVSGAIASLALFWWGLPVQDFRYAWGPLLLAMAGAALAVRTGRLAAATVSVTALALGAVVFNAAIHRCAQSWMLRGDPRERAFDSRRWAAIAPAWRYIDAEVRGKTIAYSGNNIPYFLYGRRVENRVVYVPARNPMLRRYDQWAALPESKALGPPRTSEPTFDRWLMDPAAWIENLRERGVEYFVVNSLDLCPNLTLTVRHDADGFPIERTWLDALARAGAAERITFPDPRVLVYRLHLDRLTHIPPALQPIRQDETDSLDRAHRLNLAPNQPIPDYPLAAPYIERHGLRTPTGA